MATTDSNAILKDIIPKFNLIKVALIAEKEKNAKLQSELNSLRDDLTIQQQITARLQEEKKGNSKEEPLQKLFDEGGKAKEVSKSKEEQIFNLTKENSALKEKIASLENEKEYLDGMLNDLLKQYSQLKETSDIQLSELKEQHDLKNHSHIEDTKRLESMSAVLKALEMDKIKLEKEKFELEKENDLLLKSNNAKGEGYEKLFEDQTFLCEEKCKLQEEIEELKNENKHFREYIEEISPITINTVFKGNRILCKNPRKTASIEMSYGEIEKSLVIREENENGKVFRLKFITDMVKVDPNMVKFNIDVEGMEVEYLIEFGKKYISYILKFYIDGTLKKKFVENLVMAYSLGDYSG